MVDETNRCAEQDHRKNPLNQSLQNRHPSMYRQFTRLCFPMGILPLHSRHNYWRQNKFIFVTSFNKVMSRGRCDLIWRYVHLQDNDAVSVDEERPDQLRNISWYLDYLDQIISYNNIPKNNTTIDESMIKFKSRLSFRQYLPGKPTKCGVQL